MDKEASTAVDVADRLPLPAPARPAPTPQAVAPPRARQRPRFWSELAIVLAFYVAYELTSDVTGGSRKTALANALGEVHLEQALGIFREHAIQQYFLHLTGWIWVVKGSDVFYATVHFIMPVVVLVWLWLEYPHRYRRWRNAMAWLSGVSLIVFVVDPVMPPRLLPAGFGFVDTLARVGGAGPLDHILLSSAGNAYAAMPSLHVAWAAWCAAALAPAVRRRWLRVLLVADPVVTIFVVIVTANHLFLDVAGGLLVLAVGIGLAWVPWVRGTTALLAFAANKRKDPSL